MSLQILFDRLHDAWKRCDWPNLRQAVRISPPWTNKHIKNPHTHARIKSQSCLKFSMLHGIQWEVKGALLCKIPTTTQRRIYMSLYILYPFAYGRVCNASCVNPELSRKTYGHNKRVFPFFSKCFLIVTYILP